MSLFMKFSNGDKDRTKIFTYVTNQIQVAITYLLIKLQRKKGE